MPRILVCMSDNRNLEKSFLDADYNSLVASINYEYCKTHKYDFVYYRPYFMKKDETKLRNCIHPITKNVRHASWSKLLSTSLALQMEYDYVVYIDSDCIFKDFSQSLEEFLKPYSDKDILFLNNKPWGDTLPCAGFYICKVNEHTRCFIQDWYNYNIPEKDTTHAWEQDALWEIIRLPRKCTIGIIDSWMFRETDQQFLRHIGSLEGSNRIPYFASFVQSKHIMYEKNIHEIQCIEFDTNPEKGQ